MGANYKAIAAVKTGDLFFLARSRTWFGRLIRLFSESRYSHVGCFVWGRMDCGERELYVIEALEGVGVRHYRFSLYLRDAEREGFRIDHFDHRDPNVDGARLARYCLDRVGLPYASPWQFIRSFFWVGKVLLKTCGLPVNLDPGKRYFCSQLIAEALLAAGGGADEPGAPAPEETEPGDLADFYPLGPKETLYVAA